MGPIAESRPRRLHARPSRPAVTPLESLEGRTLLSAGHGHDHQHGPDALDVVYLATNNPTPGQNAILAYHRDADTGALTPLGDGPFLTGGTGFYNSDERLGPDDSDQEVIVSPDRKYLYVANQGSDDISVFKIKHDGDLKLVPGAPFDSGGRQPVSLGLARNDTLVVVNKGDEAPGQTSGERPNYTSFRIRGNGRLIPTGSTIAAPPGSSPSQALISPDGRHVFGTNLFARPFPPPPGFPPFVPPFASELVSLNVGRDGRLTQAPGSPSGFPLAPPAPPFILGLGAHPTQNIIYAGYVVANALGVYTYDDSGALHFVGATPLSGQGVCWIDVSDDGKFLYTSNSTSDSVSAVSLADPLHPVELQNLPLAGPKAPLGVPGPVLFNTVPFNLSLSPDQDFLYVLNHEVTEDDSFPAGNALHILHVKPDGTLAEDLPTLVLPQSAVPAGAHPLGLVVL